MGASANVSTNKAESIVSAYTDMVLQQVASCSSTLAQNQTFGLSGITTTKPIIINGIKMNQKSVMSPQCASDLTGSQKTKTALANLQKQIAKAVSQSTPLNVSGNASINASTMVTQVLDSISNKSIQDCVNNTFQNQSFGLKKVNTTNTIEISNIDMNQASKSIADCVFKSNQDQIGNVKAVSELQQEAESKSKMFSTTLIVVIVVVVVVIIIAAIVAYYIYKKNKEKQEHQEQGLNQSMEKKGISTEDVMEGDENGESTASGGAHKGGGGKGIDSNDLMKAGMMAAASSTPEGAILSALLS